MLRRRNARDTVEGEIAGAFSIRRLGGSRRRFGRTIALWGLNRPLISAAPSLLVPPNQSTHRPYIVLPHQRRCNRPDKPKIDGVRLSRSDFVQVALGEVVVGAYSFACGFFLLFGPFQKLTGSMENTARRRSIRRPENP